MKIKQFALIILVAAIGMPMFFTSCEDPEEEEPDFVEESLGGYSYTATYQFVSDPSEIFDETGSIRIEKSGENILIVLDPNTDDEANIITDDLTIAGNGYGFNINPVDGIDDERGEFEISGLPGFTLGEDEFHGAYNAEDEQLKLYLLVAFEEVEHSFAITFLANKL